MMIEVRPALDDDGDLALVAGIVNATTPDDPTSIEEMRWSDRTYPGSARFLGTVGGRPVGVGTVGRIYMYPPEFEAYWATLHVLADARRQGVGTQLLDSVSKVARADDKPFLHVPVSEARPDSIAFLAHRGFTELDRTKTVRLELVGLEPSVVRVPPGFTLTTLGARPDLIEGVHAVAVETFADIPGGGEPMAAGNLAEFRARDVDRPSVPEWGFIIAIEDETDAVAGYASLSLLQDGSAVAWHDMTAVLRAWRGRGLATALKEASIRAAIDHGIAALETGNDETNLPMRAVNARLGYRPLPDQLTMRGPLLRGIMDS